VTPPVGDWWNILELAIQEGLDTRMRAAELAAIRPPKAAVVFPSLLTGGTDSKHLRHLSENGVFRFLPLMLNRTAGDLALVHGIDERISQNSLLGAINTYTRALQLFGRTG
jgi:acetylornithine deacetylase/succinyl-diaminopimelate desuccinylase-like protein